MHRSAHPPPDQQILQAITQEQGLLSRHFAGTRCRPAKPNILFHGFVKVTIVVLQLPTLRSRGMA
jgi:hypothetical protein